MRNTILTATLMTASLFGSRALAQPQPAEAAPPTTWSDRNERAVVVATNEGNVDLGMVNSLVQLLSEAFTAKGLTLVSSPQLASPVVLDDTLGARAQAAGASRIFVLHILRLNEKTLLQVEERTPDNHSVYATTLVPGDVEASDEVLPRLADAVLRHIPATETAEVTNVTKQETGTHNRSHFTLGVPGGSVAGQGAGGLELGYQFETARFALGVSATLAGGNAGTGLAVTDVYGLYFFLPGAITPYVGAGMGYGGTWSSNNGGGAGAMAEAEAGVEFLRFNHTHFDLGAQAFLPFYTVSNELDTNPVTTTNTYQPSFLAKARIAF